ncbi:unnamed protein product [Urochloa decumbens]|uniref:Protein LURP-one-related 8 n=1 Tax=Urochloa decumbens TaxID=240449 RepID=A0ABC9B978_9POAL
MAKVHPNASDPAPTEPEPPPSSSSSSPAPATEELLSLTVWRKSLLFNCDGFTVFDAKGNLAFRVDCYGASGRRRAEVVLMDVAGKPLLTLRRKKLSLADHWVIYDGDAAAEPSKARPLLSVRRHVSLRASSKTVAHVTPHHASASAAEYVVEGSYGRRACAVRDARGDAVVAEVRRKESVGDDVFRLVVADPRRLGAPLAMGLVIALDEMFAAGRRGSSSARSLLRRTWSV